jgi:hypothetical protein
MEKKYSGDDFKEQFPGLASRFKYPRIEDYNQAVEDNKCVFSPDDHHVRHNGNIVLVPSHEQMLIAAALIPILSSPEYAAKWQTWKYYILPQVKLRQPENHHNHASHTLGHHSPYGRHLPSCNGVLCVHRSFPEE